ncbi:MAG: SMI1/KNR4 family protein [Lachnospiraceae bacterium]|nr:SMI1/KNR4 family protein [Lachnospiraceae bacterium]
MFDSENIKDIFDKTYETDALIVKPAADEEIERCNKDLDEISGGTGEDYIASIKPGARKSEKEKSAALSLPDDYTEFLKIANGYAWNGFQFFGTYQVTVKKSGYTLLDIVSVNQNYRERKFGLKDMIVLGDFDDDLYAYDFKSSKYLVMDQITLTPFDEYDSFDELFTCTVGAYAYYDDEWPDDEFDDDDIIEDDGNADQ